MLNFEVYKVINIQQDNIKLKNPYQVIKLCYVDKENKPTYKYIRGFSSEQKANDFINQLSAL